jgi:lipoyl-dependent peroxiredoxin
MHVRQANAEWKGNLTEGTGTVSTESGALSDAPYSFPSRFEEGEGSNPEELIGAALAACFSMALSADLAKAGHDPVRVATEAQVHFGKTDEGPAIVSIELICEAEVPGIDAGTFKTFAEDAKSGCPIARALKSVPILLDAALAG